MSDTPKTKKELIKEEHGIRDVTVTNTNNNNIYISYLETDKYILEQIISATRATCATSPRDTSFLCFDKVSGTTEEKMSFEHEGRLYCPIVGQILDNNVIMLPTKAQEYGSVNKLVKQLREFFSEYFEAPRFSQNLFPYLVIFYWVYDRFPFIPYVHFMGRTGTGKTTAMEVLGSVCYKPIDASGAITLASIFRVISEWRGTLLIDEFAPGGDGYREMLSLLKSGVSDRAVLRVEGEKKREVKAYIVKSPKLFTSEKPIHDVGLRSRVIEVRMEKNTKRIPLYRQKDFLDEAQELRNKLLLWRFRKLSKIDLTEIKYGFKALKGFDGRTQQVITPIYYMANEEARKDIVDFAKEQEAETLRDRREAVDGQVFQIIMDKLTSTSQVTLSMVFEELTKTEKNKYLTPRKLGNIVRKLLGIDIERRGHENVRVLILEGREEKLRDLGEYYGVVVPLPMSGEQVAQVDGVASGTACDLYEEKEIKELFDGA